MDDAAVAETLFCQGVTHDGVVLVGVYAQVGMVLAGIAYGSVHDATDLATASYAVYGGIGGIVEPRPLVDMGIGGVGACVQGKAPTTTQPARSMTRQSPVATSAEMMSSPG